MENITLGSHHYIMEGVGTFWPVPLQRQGPCTTKIWTVTLPNGFSPWLHMLGERITEEWKDLSQNTDAKSREWILKVDALETLFFFAVLYSRVNLINTIWLLPPHLILQQVDAPVLPPPVDTPQNPNEMACQSPSQASPPPVINRF